MPLRADGIQHPVKSRKTIASEIARGSDPTKDYVSPPPKAASSGPVNSPPGSGPESYELRNKMRFPRTRSLDSLDSGKLAPAEELVANNGGVPIKIRVYVLPPQTLTLC